MDIGDGVEIQAFLWPRARGFLLAQVFQVSSKCNVMGYVDFANRNRTAHQTFRYSMATGVGQGGEESVQMVSNIAW